MMSDSSVDSESDWDLPARKKKRKGKKASVKRRKRASGTAVPAVERQPVLLQPFNPLLALVEVDLATSERCFEDTMHDLLPDLLKTRAILQERSTEITQTGARIRPLTRGEVVAQLRDQSSLSPIAARKLKLHSAAMQHQVSYETESITPAPRELPSQVANTEVVEALERIQTTPFENSFLARLHGPSESAPILAVDWTIETPWMRLISDIWAHHSLAHPEREQAGGILAPITFVSLSSSHLDQVHDLLSRTFWPGIDVSDSLDFSPERCTVVALYKRLVVGVAIMSSPRETYVTYLAVKAGWDNSHIARSMLYHLIRLNPKKDITLHVSTNNSAMLLYNRFGFKAEEFVVGFYEEYLSPQSRQSNNAFRLRLRQQ
ncbi:hypothetical protein BDN72DRAFT_847777 [Pluteus cervinus]|uniref:Uncharacterized protein n=1 Tax=Pluteus cervinus TaxID=181527 RepID=A0ACD3ABJ4_9AGAR|nr:hypothetical protein BDN72DRAFT_847777 [Pluteus cervinus]